MSAEKFASLTSNLLLRGGEARSGGIVPSEPVAFPRGLHQRSNGHLARRADAPPARRRIIAPIGIDPNGDGSVTLTVSDAAENFRHDEEAQGWIGDCGSFLDGGSNLFSETQGWQIAISVDQGHNPSVEIRHHNGRLRVKFDGFADSLFS